jgi:HAD superfamily hydrolase (TIGR01549 family)
VAIRLGGVFWDFDGTLVNTREKNLTVNRRIIEMVTGRPYHSFPALTSVEFYHAATNRAKNWRTFYQQEYGLDEASTDQAGRLWTEFQLADSTPARFYDGIRGTLQELRAVPNGIVSQNSAENIRALLRGDGLDQLFAVVVGYEEVPFDRQKPDPHGLLRCIDAVKVEEGSSVFYIGDHATDAECAFNANQALRACNRQIRVISIAASFEGPSGSAMWPIPPEHVAHHPREIVEIAAKYQGGKGDVPHVPL